MARLTQPAFGFVGDVVDLVKQYGRRAIPSSISSLPYLEEPTWRAVGNHLFSVNIAATLHRSRGGVLVSNVNDGDIVPKNFQAQFFAKTATGLPLDSRAYETRWRVTNTGEDALSKDQLRGSIKLSHAGGVRWEKLEYRGVSAGRP